MSLVPTTFQKRNCHDHALGFRVQGYGMRTWADLFTNRQLTALTTFSDLGSRSTRAHHRRWR